MPVSSKFTIPVFPIIGVVGCAGVWVVIQVKPPVCVCVCVCVCVGRGGERERRQIGQLSYIRGSRRYQCLKELSVQHLPLLCVLCVCWWLMYPLKPSPFPSIPPLTYMCTSHPPRSPHIEGKMYSRTDNFGPQTSKV